MARAPAAAFVKNICAHQVNARYPKSRREKDHDLKYYFMKHRVLKA
ncbi:hypothetical protein EL26_13780 [Acetobacter orientalis]|uniref:Uncharacterized protein n=1 Tax=Acetobacter orientalis TaxID=146474 RepID=A0A2Z5ZJ14_9PROT|nr:hypothetical protein EL26_13780 [Acetobacter orientalis]